MSGWNYSIFWKEAKNQFKTELNEQEFTMWFNMEYHSSSESSIILSVPSSFYRDQIKQRYQSKIENKLQELSGQPLNIEFIVKPRVKEEMQDQERAGDSETPYAAAPVLAENRITYPARQAIREKTTEKQNHPMLRADYTFNHFVVGENSSFAYNAAMAISKNPGISYNPCLIYGGVGLGKTHLIQAVGNYIHAVSDKKIIYTTAENFTNEFIQALQDKTTKDFKNKYRSADILLIDDIHFLQKKVETQEELFHTFNALYDANKQMIFTCDRPLSEIKNMSERLCSRFERGLNVDLQPPSYETRCAILNKKAEHKSVSIPQEVIELIALNIASNVRDLEACLTKLIAYSELVNKSVTLDVARQQLRDTFNSPKDISISIEMIQKVVSNYFNISYQDMKGKKRTRAIAFPRQIAMYIAREITEYSTTELGMEFGGRDHTTVMHACQKIDERLKSDSTLEPMLRTLIHKIKEYEK
ncbi:MAG: chromosomal replication initiator protein DnaA [Spirochaetaceae bacterium]|jgi:chromosomal replication initiator protein|nr:chromosomal replication initiator protein DnaA [Spirochaetaceae bacterium]